MLRSAALAFFAYIAAPIAHFISLKLLRGLPLRRGLVSNFGQWAAVAVLWIESVIDIALKVVGPMKPRTGANEDAAR